MEELLIEFINTLDLLLKKMQAQVGDGTGMSKLTIHQFQYLDAIFLGKFHVQQDEIRQSEAIATFLHAAEQVECLHAVSGHGDSAVAVPCQNPHREEFVVGMVLDEHDEG